MSFARVQQAVARVLTYDFCPWANRWLYWLKRPLAGLCLAGLVSLACAVCVQPLAWLPCGAVLFVLLMGYAWPWFAIRGMTAQIQFPQRRVTEGETAKVHIRMTNFWPWPVWGLCLEQISSSTETVALARIGARSTAEFVWEFVPTCRGVLPPATPQITTGFPFGLTRACRNVTFSDQLLVWPATVPLEMLLDAAETRPADDTFSNHRTGDSGDLTGTRPFRDGDSLRRVHWAQTARHGRLIVCERQAPIQSAIRVVFDSDPELHRGVGADNTLEWSIRIAASVCQAYHRANAQVECCFGHTTLPLLAGQSGWTRFMDHLAQWQPCASHHGHHCEHEHGPQHCRRIHHHNCGVFQLTITTDVGYRQRTEHRHVHGDQRFVILETATPAPLTTINDVSDRGQLAASSDRARLAIVLDQQGHRTADFQRKWRTVCHAG